MTALDLDQRAALADRLLPVATRLAEAVHDYEHADVRQQVAAVDPDDVPALLVVLAGMVDVERPVTELLGWCSDDVQLRRDARTWTDPVVGRHHAAWQRGRRDRVTEVGQREYDRRRKARQRAIGRPA